MGLLVYSNDNAILAAYLWRQRQTKPLWEVVAEVIKLWKKRNPEKWKSYIFHLKDIKSRQKITNVGSKSFKGVVKDKENDAYFSMVVDFPVWIMQALRKLYTSDELSMNQEFFRKFAKMFPEFAVREKV